MESAQGISPIIADNSGRRFEAAGTIETVMLLYTLKNNVDLNSQLTYYWPVANSAPDSGACPLVVQETSANARTIKLQTVFNAMMAGGHNIYARAFMIKYGRASLTGLMSAVGMTNFLWDQEFIGCAFRTQWDEVTPYNGLSAGRKITLADIALLWRSVEQGVSLSGGPRTTFYLTLPGGIPQAGDAWYQVVQDEASRLGKTPIAQSFINAMDVRYAASSYALCMASGCAQHKRDMNHHGRVTIPFKPAARNFLFGAFVEDVFIPCAPTGTCGGLGNANNELWNNPVEAARATINQALQGW